MSHRHYKEEKIVCPNCGFTTTKNYCAQCGQETHLHKETFIGLIIHFVGHYFHYDSKFWQTLKTLITKPGKLTVAYWEKKRMRYIAPISLYIFVSAVFFLFFFSTVATKKNIQIGLQPTTADSIAEIKEQDSLKQVLATLPADSVKKIEAKIKRSELFRNPDSSSELINNLVHAFPKFFFFMIPLMAFVLKLLYIKRKDTFFVDHAIFSLHVHAFTIISLLLSLYETSENPNFVESIITFLQMLIFPGILLYLIIALRNVYKSTWIRSIMYGVIISVTYILCFLITSIGYFAFITWQALHS